MGVTIKEIYSWEDLPSGHIKRQYLPVDNGIVTGAQGDSF